MKEMQSVVHKYLRETHDFPTIWCPGCTHGVTMNGVINAIDELGYKKDDVIMVSGIGCSSRAPNYFDFNAIHGTHGKAIPFATGAHLAQPDKKIIVFTGDGDGAAIGGNHLIHAARRNIDITCILLNNSIYGMTGGQYSPTTPEGAFGATAPYTTFEYTFDLCKLVAGAGGTYVARVLSVRPRILIRTVKEALQRKGFSFVEVVSCCPPVFGFYNRDMNPVSHYKKLRESGLDVKRAEEMVKNGQEIPKDKIITGVFKDEARETLFERYKRVCVNSNIEPFSLYLNTLDIAYQCDED